MERGQIAERKIELIKDQIIGDQAKRNAHMEKTIERVRQEQDSYLAKLEEQKKRELKQKELETKKYLDLQIQEKKAKDTLVKAQDSMDAVYINKDVRAFEEQERKRKEQLEKVMREHQASLQQQMGNKSKGPVMAVHEFQLNKKIIEQIETGNSLTNSPPQKKPF